MNKVKLFENEYFLSERLEDGSTEITILKDKNKFYGICLDNCKLITNSYGFIDDKFTAESIEHMKKYCFINHKSISKLQTELRNRTLNTLLNYII